MSLTATWLADKLVQYADEGDLYNEAWPAIMRAAAHRLRAQRDVLQLIDASTPTDNFIAGVKDILSPTDLAVQQALNAMGNIARGGLAEARRADEGTSVTSPTKISSEKSP